MLSTFYKARKKRLDGEQGFTLIELLVVVVILGILIAIAIPVYLNYRQSANDKAAQSDLRNAISVLEVCNSDGAYPSAIDPSTLVMTGCTTQSIKRSDGTLLKYTAGTNAYVLAMGNSSGSGKIYCYDSAAGGSVKTSTSTGKTQAAVTAVTTC